MKTIRLVRGTDILDLRERLGGATHRTASGREVPKFVLHALESRSPATDAELRGHPVEVTDAQALELLTFPNLTIEEVEPGQAHADRYLRTLTRDHFGNLIDPTTGVTIDPASPPVAAPLATGEARDPDEIGREVEAELAAQQAAQQAAQGAGAASETTAAEGDQGEVARRRGK